MQLLVQIFGGSSTKSITNSDLVNELKDKTNEQINEWLQKNPLTFIAYSDTMKARVLEQFMKSPLKIGLSIYDGEQKDGEWHELANSNAVFNR